MSRPSLSTPCPPGYTSFGARGLNTISLGAQDDTADLDYTRAITQEFTKAKPRRRSTFQRPERKNAPITIFEDVVEDQELVIAESKKEIGGSTLLGKAARKMPRSSAITQRENIPEEESAQEDARSKRRVSTLADSIPSLRFKMPEPARDVPAEVKPQGGLKKDPRRRTIFVPSDDTTMLTIHPGANTTDRLNDTFQLPSLTTVTPPPCTTQELQERPSPKPTARRARMSLAVEPKRLPLQQMAIEKGNVPAFDMPGQNGGKENLPPRIQASTMENKPSSRFFAPTAASKARGSVQARQAVQPPPSNLRRTQSSVPSKSNMSQRDPIQPAQRRSALPSQRTSNQQKPSAPSGTQRTTLAHTGTTDIRQRPTATSSVPGPRFVLNKPHPHPIKRSSPSQRSDFAAWKASKLQQYPVLPGDLAQPDLYEDDWLKHQEVALTEVINELLSGTNRKDDQWFDTAMSLRERLVDIYHQPRVSTLHQRLQASLQFGALSLPRDTPPTLPSQDIGLRKRYLQLWLDTYDEKLLKDAAQVVIGRQIPEARDSSGHGPIDSNFDPHHGRRGLIKFLEAFFVEAQDVTPSTDMAGTGWRKTVTRSLMLTWLLDEAKTSHAISSCLFKASSPHKSSTQVLNSLATIVLPSSVGDITRALGHCDYVVSHQQDPLDEVTYRIENIASDLRDGILLCRLAESLLYPSAQNKLSQHLKMPCIGRAQKVFNADIAISALHDHGSLREAASQVTADDVVNGHREKTLSLLWALVSTHGLASLVDFRELMRDILKNDATADLPIDQQYLAQHQQEELLQAWATAICTKQNDQVENLTTSFADGRAYAAIVESFAPFCNIDGQAAEKRKFGHTASIVRTSVNPQRTCATTLRALGCSIAFTASLTSTTTTLTNRQTTLSNLAFLASRLLPLKRRHNAAVTIQRAARLMFLKRMVARRVKLMRLAHACATIVRTQQRLVNAATVLQRAWRGVLEAKIGRLNADVEEFQLWAKGWLIRRRTKASGHGRAVQGRVMGGW